MPPLHADHHGELAPLGVFVGGHELADGLVVGTGDETAARADALELRAAGAAGRQDGLWQR